MEASKEFLLWCPHETVYHLGLYAESINKKKEDTNHLANAILSFRKTIGLKNRNWIFGKKVKQVTFSRYFGQVIPSRLNKTRENRKTKRENTKKYWCIRGFDSTQMIFEKFVPLACFSRTQIEAVLKALTARASLSYEEIVGAYARRGRKESNDLLEIRKDPLQPQIFSVINPHFIANIVDESHRPIVYKPLDT